MRFPAISEYSSFGMKALHGADNFWENPDVSTAPLDLIRYSTMMGFMAFSGYLVSYAAVGHIWNYWPFIRTTLPILRAIFCAGLQWIFFAVFPILSSIVLDFVLVRKRPSNQMNSWLFVCTYSLTPLYIAALFVGIPFIGRLFAVLSLATFAYMLYFGFRTYCRHSFVRSIVITCVVFVLFAFIRQMFVYVIGV